MFATSDNFGMPWKAEKGCKPTGLVKIDINDPLSVRLRNVLVLNDSFRNKGEPLLYTRNEFEMLGAGSKKYNVFDDLSWLIGKSEFTFAFGFTPRVIDDNNMILGMGKSTGQFNSDQTIGFWADNSDFNTSAVDCLSFQHSTSIKSGTASRVISASNSIKPNVRYDVVCRQSLTVADILINGSLSGNQVTYSLSPVSSLIDEAYLGGLTVTLNKPMDGALHYLYVFEGAISDQEAIDIMNDNYRCIIKV
jgi:hypothetical protein